MSEFAIHTIESAPTGSHDMLQAVKSKYGFIPNLMGEFAESPAMLDAYLAVAKAFDERTNLTPTERHIVLLATSFTNSCHYCMAVHTTTAQGARVDAAVVEALRTGEPIADAKLQALREFTTAVVTQRGWLDEGALERFLAAGYTRAQALDVLVGVGLKTMSNYTNHLAHTPVDPAFEANVWQRAEATA